MIVVVGLSHRTASIAVRERLAISSDAVPELLRETVARPAVGEAMLISTCNRTELVAAGPKDGGVELDDVAGAALAVLSARAPGVAHHLYVHQGATAVRHLFRVASSLDSLVLGEPHILGQVKHAFEVARSSGTVGIFLNSTVPRAIRAAKRVRTETSIGRGQVSVPSVAVDLSRQIFADLRGRAVALVGSGEMAETVARLLRQSGARLSVTGRNAERVRAICESIEGIPRRFSDLVSTIVEADVVITSTSAKRCIITYDMLDRARRARRGRSLFLIDLAVPRDVEPKVDSIDGVFLYNVDDFSRVVAESAAGREREAAHAEEIVKREVAGWDRWAEAMHVTPAIVALRERFRAVLEAEMSRSLRGRLKHLGPDERESISKMVHAAVNKLLHEPSRRLRDLGDHADASIAVLNELFALDAPAAVRDLARARDSTCPQEREPITHSGPEGHDERPTGTGER